MKMSELFLRYFETLVQGQNPSPAKSDPQLKKGVMVALSIPAEVLPPEVEDPHLTLLYLGKVDKIAPELLEAFKTALWQVASQWSPFALTLTGLGQFQSATEDKWVDYLSASSPALPGLRQQIVDTAMFSGLDLPTKWGFTPHVTIKYVDPETPMGSYSYQKTPFDVSEIQLWIAGEVIPYPLVGQRSFGIGDGIFGQFKDHPDKYRLESDHRYHRIEQLSNQLPQLTRTAEERHELGTHITHHLRENLNLPAEFVIPKSGKGEIHKFQMYHGYAKHENPDMAVCKQIDKHPEDFAISAHHPNATWSDFTRLTGCKDPVEFRSRMLGKHPMIDHQTSEMILTYTPNVVMSEFELMGIHGESLGKMTRRHEGNGSGGLDSVQNDHFELNPEFQGLGIGESIYQSQEEANKVAGYEWMGLSANISVGGYAWAKQGYDFRHAQEFHHVMKRMDERFETMPDEWKEQYGNQYQQDSERFKKNQISAYELAAYRIGDEGMGRMALLGSSWLGEKRLHDSWRGNASANLSRARLFGIPVRYEE